jgi:glycine/serine hydroxymethyltransferase
VLDSQSKRDLDPALLCFYEVAEITSPRESHDRVLELLQQHHKWFSESIPLIASENVPSPAVREAIVSDFGNRYAE